MRGQRVGSWLSLLRQGLSVEAEFGTHSLETLVSIAETVEESVYDRGSLARTERGFSFRMNNPPLRTGAFSTIRLRVLGGWVPPENARIRVGGGRSWLDFARISSDHPVEFRPGAPIEIQVDAPLPAGTKELDVRLEFQSTAIPPLVWFEFTDALVPLGRA